MTGRRVPRTPASRATPAGAATGAVAPSDPGPDEIAFTPEDVAVARALGGTPDAIMLLRAHVTATAGEHRPQQEQMAETVQTAIMQQHPLLVQAGTGTGKSLAYLFAVAASGRRTVIATATNQLSDQLIRHDLPTVAATLADTDQPVTYAMLKGRSNYVCKAKIAELDSLDVQAGMHGGQDTLFPTDDAATPTVRQKDARALTRLMTWARTTTTGDRSEGDPGTDRVWSQVSVSQAECAGRECPFYQDCFTELARRRARAANIVVTNHALLAQDMKMAVQQDQDEPVGSAAAPATLFGPHDVVIVDEAHALADSLTSALSQEVSPAAIDKFLRRASIYVDDPAKDSAGESVTVTTARADLDNLIAVFSTMPTGPILDLTLEQANAIGFLAVRLADVARLLITASIAANTSGKPKRATAITLLAGQATEYATTTIAARGDATTGTVRWIDRGRDGQPPVMRVAPLHIGDLLNTALEARTFIGTSATLTVAGSFTGIAHTLSMGHATMTDVGTPFSYPTQGMLYIPNASVFPEPVGRERTAHTAAVLTELTALVTAAGGRTLALFTTTAGAQRAAAHLRDALPDLTVLAHGDAPADALVRDFRDDETSVLCATMGLWQGTDVPGPSCFPAGTLIRTSQGHKPIETITVGDRVWTHKRRYRTVTTVMAREYAGDLVEVHTDGTVPVRMTPEHPVLTTRHAKQSGAVHLNTISDEWVPAGDLTTDHRLVLPVGDQPANINRLTPVLSTNARPAERTRNSRDGSPDVDATSIKYHVSPVRQIERVPFDGLVYNFSVDTDESYCVPGFAVHNCSLVVIDKVSFAPIDDVLTAARRTAADEDGRDGFSEVIVGQAAISLAQAVGRLIRHRSDRGVVAILDPRVLTKGYGRTLLNSLPDFPRYTDQATVLAALTRLTGGHVPSPRTGPARSAGTLGKPKSSTRGRAPRRSAATRRISTRGPRPSL
jgi:ATP-dependent DNA helicase DinG